MVILAFPLALNGLPFSWQHVVLALSVFVNEGIALLLVQLLHMAV